MIVVECLNEVLFRIQSGPKSKPQVVHHDKLKPYLGEDKSEWGTTSSVCCARIFINTLRRSMM